MVGLVDDADAIAKKIRKAKTDPEALPSEAKGLEERPEARNLVDIYAALNEQSVDQVLADVGGKQFSEFKPMLADLAVGKLAPTSMPTARSRRVGPISLILSKATATSGRMRDRS